MVAHSAEMTAITNDFLLLIVIIKFIDLIIFTVIYYSSSYRLQVGFWGFGEIGRAHV